MKTKLLNAGFVSLGNDELRVEAPYFDRRDGKKLRVKAGREDEPEPGLWNFYKHDGERFQLVREMFKGSRDEAVAACIAEHGRAN